METIRESYSLQIPTQSHIQTHNSHTGLKKIHTDVISSQMQNLVLLGDLLGVKLQCTSGCSAVPFPSTVLDRESRSSIPKSSLLSLSDSSALSINCEGGGWRSSGSDYKTTVFLLMMRSPKGVYSSEGVRRRKLSKAKNTAHLCTDKALLKCLVIIIT